MAALGKLSRKWIRHFFFFKRELKRESNNGCNKLDPIIFNIVFFTPDSIFCIYFNKTRYITKKPILLKKKKSFDKKMNYLLVCYDTNIKKKLIK